jgi:hypothetical protein
MRRSLVLVMSLVIAGCGGAAKQTTAPPSSAGAAATTISPATDAGLRQAVEAYSAAYLGDRPGAAYGLLSARCRSQLTLAQMMSLSHGAKLLYGSAKLIDYHEDEVVGYSARVTYSYDQPAINQSGQRWTREKGEWHWDGC